MYLQMVSPQTTSSLAVVKIYEITKWATQRRRGMINHITIVHANEILLQLLNKF